MIELPDFNVSVPKTTVTKGEGENALDELVHGSFSITLDGRHPETTDNRSTWFTTHIVTPTTQKMGGVINGIEGLYYVIVENNVIYNCYYNAGSNSWDKVEESEYNQENWLATYNYASKESGNVIIDEIFHPYYLTYDSFSYDENTDRYLCEEISLSDGLNHDKYTDIVVSFANGKIQEISCTFFDISSDNDVTAKITITVSCAEEDIVITLPDFNVSAPIATVTEEQWETAFTFDVSFLQAKLFEADLSGEAELIFTENAIRYTETYNYDSWYACYMEKTEGGWFVYEGETNAGSSVENIKNYSKEFCTEPFFSKDSIKIYTEQFSDCYENFKYDENNQSYIANSIALTDYHYDEKLGYADAEFSEVSISFANNRISQVCYTQTLTYSNGETEEDAIRVEFSYDEVEIVFPTVTE